MSPDQIALNYYSNDLDAGASPAGGAPPPDPGAYYGVAAPPPPVVAPPPPPPATEMPVQLPPERPTMGQGWTGPDPLGPPPPKLPPAGQFGPDPLASQMSPIDQGVNLAAAQGDLRGGVGPERQPTGFTRDVAPKPAAGGAGVGSADPFGQRAAEKAITGSYDAEREALTRKKDAEGARLVMEAQYGNELARRKQEDAAISSAKNDAAREHFDRDIGEMKSQLDDVRSKKIDPLSGADPVGLAALGLAGMVLGGLYMRATNSSTNPFLSELDKMIDRGIDAQKEQIANNVKGLEGQMNLLQRQREIFKDSQAADLAARNVYYEAMKDQLEAEKKNYQIPEAQANADMAIAEINRKQALVQKEFGDKRAAAAAAAASQSYARAEKITATYRDTYDKALKAAVESGQPLDKAAASAEYEAKRMLLVLYPQQGVHVPDRPPAEAGMPGGALGKAGREKIATESFEAQRELDANLAAIDSAKKDVKNITAGGTIGNYYSAAPAWAPGATGARKDVNTRDAYNTRVKVSVGAAYKLGTDATEPKNKAMVEELAAPYTILPSDNEDLAVQKMDALHKFLSESAAAKGAAPSAQKLDLKPVK